ncbi:MAG: hypothetical protein K5668_03690 [Lachnospiraceae bacterium]|nr:hypothetical protein [Lachnospiraceae bacterium]
MAEKEVKGTVHGPDIGIIIGGILFILALCIAIGIVSFFSLKAALYGEYEEYLSDIIHYVDRHIDDDDLKTCVDTLNRSEKFDELELFMDGIKEDFSVHFLYILKPLRNEDKTESHIMSVISAEDYHNRYEDTSGNLYLGWVSDDEYDAATVDKLFRTMEKDDICFFESPTDWGVDYTGALALRDSNGEAFAVLCADVDITEMRKLIGRRMAVIFGIIAALGVLYSVFYAIWLNKKLKTRGEGQEGSVS